MAESAQPTGRAVHGSVRGSRRDNAGWTTGTYAELRRVAVALMARERRDHTLAPTELVHEAWLKVRGGARARSRVALAATAMRATLVDHARRRSAVKRGLGERGGALDPEQAARERDAYVVALDSALVELARVDSELAQLVELRFFGGLDPAAVADALGLSERTQKRRWQMAKAWLHQRILAS
jgi:RNA polymerase sigma-70 factor (ECF subfamily)